MNNSTLDANIPTLTEIISSQPKEQKEKDWVEKRAAPEIDVLEEAAARVLTDKERNLLEHIMNERVLHQVQERIDFVLEHRIRDSLADALQISLEGLTAEIKRGLQKTLEEVISRAVSEEIARLQSMKK